MQTQPIWITLLTAFTGAIVAAGLSYFVRKTLDEKAQQKAERRLAYVHYVGLSDLIAMKIGLSTLLKIYIPTDFEKVFPKGKGFDLSHAVACKAVNEIKKLDVDLVSKRIVENGIFTVAIEQQVETLKSSLLTPEQLSKLPEQSVNEYLQFSKSLSEMRTLLTFIQQVIEKDSVYQTNLDWLTPDFLDMQWRSIQRFFERLRNVRSVLGVLAGVSTEASTVLLRQQLGMVNSQITELLRSRESIMAASKALASAEDESMNPEPDDPQKGDK